MKRAAIYQGPPCTAGVPQWILVLTTNGFMMSLFMRSIPHFLHRWVLLPGILWLMVGCHPENPTPDSGLSNQARPMINEISLGNLQFMEEQEEAMNRTLWAQEQRAQELGKTMEDLWDTLRLSSDRWNDLKAWRPSLTACPNWEASPAPLASSFTQYLPGSKTTTIQPHEWPAWLDQWIDDGWQLETIEIRHQQFTPSHASEPAKSLFHFRVSLDRKQANDRMWITGPVWVDWQKKAFSEEGANRIQRIDASGLKALRWQGASPWLPALSRYIQPPTNADSIDPLLIADLEEDGTPEIVLANKNLVFRFQDGTFHSSPLCAFSPGLLSTALLADINGDGGLDFIYHKHEGLFVSPGSQEGVFDQYEIPIRKSDESIHYPMVLSAGDIDQDGDLDLFMGQYRIPYEGGTLPTPFHDANDGYPFYLLENKGDFTFEDITSSSGLTSRRHRRVYSASLVDLDHRNGLDVVVVSDFAGVDLYLNQGNGQWEWSNQELEEQTHGFGMAHSFSDFNRDGRLDLLMIGMTSPTVRRLDHLGIHREGLGTDPGLRTSMTFGNRLFLSKGEGAWTQRQQQKGVILAGWAWGCTSADFDLDGRIDVYVANGLESRQSVRDYESEYWLHDAFLADSEKDSDAYLYFKQKFERTRGRGMSYGGYESNRLFLGTLDGTELDVAPLWHVGPQWDARNVGSADFDQDGRQDLVFTHFETWPDARQVLRVYLNRIPRKGNWIGFQPERGAGIPSSLGLQIQVEAGGMNRVATISSGDSYRTQHPSVIHFGLGETQRVDQATIRWPDGTQETLGGLGINQYVPIGYPGADSTQGKGSVLSGKE